MLAAYLCAVTASQFYDQGFCRSDMHLHCPLGNSCKDWCVAMDISDIRKCGKPGRYQDRDSFMDHLKSCDCVYHYSTYLLLLQLHNNNNGPKTIATEHNKRRRGTNQHDIWRDGRGDKWRVISKNTRPPFPGGTSERHSGEPRTTYSRSGTGSVSNNTRRRYPIKRQCK